MPASAQIQYISYGRPSSLWYKGAECIYRISEHKAQCLHSCLDTVTLLGGNETPRVVCLHSAARGHVERADRYFGENSFNNAGLDPSF